MQKYKSYSYRHSSGAKAIDVLQIVLIVLKAFDLIDWSWWMVLCPLWGSIIVACVIFFFVWLIKGGK